MSIRDFVPTALCALVAGILIAFVLWGAGGCSPYATAWRATAAVKAAGNLADDALAEQYEAKHKSCAFAHCRSLEASKCVSPAEYQACVADIRGAAAAWVSVARPAINSALMATITGLTMAEKVKLKPQLDWVSLLKPAACTIAKIVKQWGAYFGDKKDAILLYVSAAEGVVCD